MIVYSQRSVLQPVFITAGQSAVTRPTYSVDKQSSVSMSRVMMIAFVTMILISIWRT